MIITDKYWDKSAKIGNIFILRNLKVKFRLKGLIEKYWYLR